MQPKDVNNLKVNVYATLAYFDIFDFPLKIEELEKYLLWAKVERQVLWAFLNNDPGIQRHGDLYYFKGRRAIVDSRREKEVVAEKLWKKVNRFVPLLRAVPYVKMVAVCNSLSINNARPGSDIDLFIVARKGRLFVARTITTILFSLLGIRRHGKKVSGRFCLSFFITDDSLDLKGIKISEDDIYLPYWVLTLRPVFGLDVHEKLMKENSWIGSYFPQRDFAGGGGTASNRREVTVPVKPEGGALRALARFKEKFLNGKTGDRLEKWLDGEHHRRHQRRLASLGPEASVIVSERMLKFHNVDRRKEICERFAKRVDEVIGGVG